MRNQIKALQGQMKERKLQIYSTHAHLEIRTDDWFHFTDSIQLLHTHSTEAI